MPQSERASGDLKHHALKLNDEVVQALVVAKMAFDDGDQGKGRDALTESLGRLRQIINEMLGEGQGPAAGDFVRGHLMGRMDD